MALFYWTCTLLCLICHNNAARILGIFPTPSISHQLPFQAIMKALAARGHQVTVLSPDPLKKPVQNYTDIDLSFSYEHFHATMDFTTMHQNSAYDLLTQVIPVMEKIMDDQLSCPQVQEFIKSSNGTKFDVVFLEALLYQAYYGLIHHLGSPPLIGILSLGNVWSAADAVGSPTNPSYIPDLMLSYGNHMTFYERLQNTIFWLWVRYKTYKDAYPAQERIMRKHFGEAPPPVHEAEKNMSLLMLSTNWVFDYPAPQTPNVVTFHSLHVKKTPHPLPQDLKKFLDEANEGVIYFSLGSNVRSDHMPEEKKRIFLEVFSELPQKVLWKWESDSLPGQPSNVKLGKWLPQQDVLAHPNVKLFITQCGLQSFQEAMYHGVPLLGIPFMGDQKYNAKKIELSGVGLQLEFQYITKESLRNAINAILHDPKYQNNMKELSDLSKDEPESSLERAVWWTEYVIRHKGAKHLRTSALDLEWYQYLLLDVVLFIVLCVLAAAVTVFFILRTVYKCIKQFLGTKSKLD